VIGVAERRISIYRRTAMVVERAQATSSLTIARQPVRESVLLIRVEGGTSGGSVTISGLVGGAAASETKTLLGPGFAQSHKVFQSISSISVTGMSDEEPAPSISVEALSPGGEPQFSTASVVSGYPATFSKARNRWAGAVHGVESVGPSLLLVPFSESFDPRPNDIIRDETTLDEYLVRDVDLVTRGRLCLPSHYELSLDRRDRSI
jgi:hypothetical protein